MGSEMRCVKAFSRVSQISIGAALAEKLKTQMMTMMITVSNYIMSMKTFDMSDELNGACIVLL